MDNKIEFEFLISSIACNNQEMINKIKSLGKINIVKSQSHPIERNIRFLEDSMNSLFLKRKITSNFRIYSNFTKKKLPGDHLALLEDGTPAISHYKEEFFFNFDPFFTITYNLNEQNKILPNSFLNRFILKGYWHTPRKIRQIIRKRVRRKKRGVIYTADHFMGTSTNILSKIIENCLIMNNIKLFKPKNVFGITHDIDTKEGFYEGIYQLLNIEKKLNAPSTNFIVPYGYEYKPKGRFLEKFIDNNLEIGLHGYSHDGLLLKEGVKKMTQKIEKSLLFFQKEDIDICGFRSPWALRNKELLKVLSGFGFKYDCSSPDIDTLALSRPLPGLLYNRPILREMNNKKKTLIQIPNTYPQDVQLFEDYQLDEYEAFLYFKEKIDFIKDYDGIFIFHTHPIHTAKRLNFFEDVIKYAISSDLKPCLMRDISDKFISS